MTSWFADTFYYLALLNPSDHHHAQAVALSRESKPNVVTTAWVLTEVADGLAMAATRGAFVRLLTAIRTDPATVVIGPAPELFEAGIDLYARRPEKDWSLTDCISFLVMREHAIAEALTGDHHFEQAGFKALLK